MLNEKNRIAVLLSVILFLVSMPRALGIEALEIHPLPPARTFGAYFLTEPATNDAQITYSISERVAVGMHGIRNHHPDHIELHYGFAQLYALAYRTESDRSQFNIYLLPGVGMANKLNGVNRVAYHAAFETDLEMHDLYFNLKGTTLGAQGYSQKTFVQGRGGVKPYPSTTHELQTWFFMQALYETQAKYDVVWGPVLRFQYKSVLTEFFGSFKGAFSFAFSLYY